MHVVPRAGAWSRARSVVALAVALLATVQVPAASSAAPPPIDPQAPYTPKVMGLLSQLTLDEKLTLIEGAAEPAATNQYQAGYLPGVPRLGIPALRLADGPPGTATRQPSVGMTQTMGVAATFSRRMARRNGVVIGRDARALGIDVTLQPFINMLRDPTWGRAFNVFGEDPLLTGQTGAAEIRGIQSQGVMAQAKHYIAYESGAGTVLVDDQTLHEIYLAPFADAVDAGVASIMCSYNRLGSRENNRFACGDAQTLTGILRNELGFKGFVTSDWGAMHALPFINAGVDMEMPGSGLGGLIAPFWTKDAMRKAIANRTVSMARLDEAVARILYQEERFGLLSGASKHDVTPEPVAADERVVQRTGEQAATLLKNDGALPLRRRDLRSLALIGPGAGQTMGVGGIGERASGLASYQQIGTYDVLRRRYAGDRRVHLTYAVADDMTGTPVPASALSHDGQPGLLRTPTSGATRVDPQLNFTRAAGNALPAGYGATWTGTLTVPAAGSYWLNIQSLGAAAQLTVDGQALGNTGPGLPGLGPRYGTVKPTDAGVLPTTDNLANARAQVQLGAGAHTISVKVTPDVSGAPVQVRLNWVTPAQQQANRARAIAAAGNARTAVVFAWSRGDLSQPLPEGQDALISDVAAANPNTIVVLNNDLPLAMPWLARVRAVLDMWFPGDTGGYATANVLTGRVNPGGRLPFTWPARLDQGVANQPAQHPERTSFGVRSSGQLCTAADSPGGPRPGNADCQVTYSEGIFIGYRWYDKQGLDPLFPFGYGLSYSRFAYSRLQATRSADGGLDVTFRVRNGSGRRGDEVPQVYLGAPANPPADAQFAVRALAGYTRVTLPARGRRDVTIHVQPRQLQYWSTTQGWTTATGTRTVYVGASSRDLRAQTGVDITG